MSYPVILTKIFTYYLFILLLVSCATTPTNAPGFSEARAPEPDNESALVYIYRAFAQPTAYSVKVLVNGQKIADLANEGFTWVMLNEGYYKIDVLWPAISAQKDVHFDGKLEGGKTYFYEVKGVSSFDGSVSRTGTALFQVKNEDAEKRIQYCCRYVQSFGNSYYPYAISKETNKMSASVKDNKEKAIVNFKAIFAGKTVSGEHVKKGFQFSDYFGENGTLIEVRNNGKRKEGRWTLSESGFLCIIWENKKACGQIESGSNGSYDFVRKDVVVRRYTQFQNGNTLK